MRRCLSESGRSMVEMLGVLAIVGVISIGGIAGYTLAMRYYRANETIHELNMLSNVISQARIQGQEPDLSEFGITAEGEEFTSKFGYKMKYFTGNSQFSIDITVPNAICQSLSKMGYNVPFTVYTSDDGAGDDCGDVAMVPMAFYYTNDLSACKNCPVEDEATNPEAKLSN